MSSFTPDSHLAHTPVVICSNLLVVIIHQYSGITGMTSTFFSMWAFFPYGGLFSLLGPFFFIGAFFLYGGIVYGGPSFFTIWGVFFTMWLAFFLMRVFFSSCVGGPLFSLWGEDFLGGCPPPLTKISLGAHGRRYQINPY